MPRAVALQALHDDVGAVGLEEDVVVAVVDGRVLDYDGVGAESVPAVCIRGWVLACALGLLRGSVGDRGLGMAPTPTLMSMYV